MKKTLSKTEAKEKIADFFTRKDFTPEEAKKMKRLAMKFRISLKDYRKRFCKKCYAPLKGTTRVNKTHKSIMCGSCGYQNRFLIKKILNSIK